MLEDLFHALTEHGRVLVIVDQPNTSGALPIAVAKSMGIQVAYLPGLAMRRAADLYPGSAKTDARDAFVIADTARTMPHTLRRVDAGEDTLAELKVLVGFDEDSSTEATRLSNRIRGLLTQIDPALERVVGPRLTTKRNIGTPPIGTGTARGWSHHPVMGPRPLCPEAPGYLNDGWRPGAPPSGASPPGPPGRSVRPRQRHIRSAPRRWWPSRSGAPPSPRRWRPSSRRSRSRTGR